MNSMPIKLSDAAQGVAIHVEKNDDGAIRLDISDSYTDIATEIIVSRDELVKWCRALIDEFDR